MQSRQDLFGAVLGTLLAELDWERLGRTYCDGDGTDFFDEELRERWLDVGLQIAEMLAVELHGSSGRSVYIGAALAEVPTILVESIVLGRDVVWINLPGEEIDELTRVLRIAADKFDVVLPGPSFERVEDLPRASFDHVWMVSVLTDPDHFPALHDALYERHGTDLATGRGSQPEDRARADQLASSVLDVALWNGILTTTDEELEILRPLALARSWEPRAVGAGLISALVGDHVRLHRLVGSRGFP